MFQSAPDSGSPNLGSLDVEGMIAEYQAANPGQAEPSPDETSDPAPAAHPEPEAQPAPQTVQELEFTWNGKQIKAPIDRAKQWAQQGYDYAQKMAEFNRTQQEFQGRQKEFDERYGNYSKIDEYARQNPEWWQSVQQAWEQREQARQLANPNDPYAQKFQTLESQLSQVSQFIQQQQQREQEKVRLQEDQSLSESVQSMRKAHAYLDWDSIDQNGHNLELRVLDFAQKNGIKGFDQAFKLYNHEEFLKRAEERGKEAVTKDIQKKTKLGLLGSTPTPKKGLSHAQDLKSKSYLDLAMEGLAELGGDLGA